MCKTYEGKIRMFCKCTENETEHYVYTETSGVSDFKQFTNYFYVCTKCKNEIED